MMFWNAIAKRTLVLALTTAVGAAASTSAATMYWAGTGDWNSTNTNWATANGGPYNTTWANNGDAVFEGTSGTVTLTENCTASSLTFDATDYVIADGSILRLSDAGTINTAANTATISTTIGGTGSLTKIGSGTLILNKNIATPCNYAIGTYVNEGTLQVGATESWAPTTLFGSEAKNIHVNSGGTLLFLYRDFADNLNITINGGKVTSSTGTIGAENTLNNLALQNGGVLEVTKAGSYGSCPTYTLTGTVTASGNSASAITTTGSTGWISLGNNLSTGGATTFDVSDVNGTSDADLTISAKLTNPWNSSSSGQVAGLTKTGAGTLVLAGGNTNIIAFSGDTNIDNGTLQIGATEIDAPSFFDSSARKINVNTGGTLKFLYSQLRLNAAAITINGGTITSSTGSSAFNVLNNLTLQNGGVLEVTKACFGIFANYALSGTVTASGTSASSITGAGTTGWLSLGTNISTGGTTTFDVADVNGSNDADLTISAKIANPYGGTAVSGLTKKGAGTMVLSGVNTYTGETTVSDGALLVNGSLANSSVSVSGGTLGGSGSIAGAVSLGNVATLAPGTAGTAGTLTLGNGLILADGAKLAFDLAAAAASDKISMAATFALNSLDINDFSFTSLDGFDIGNYTLIAASGISGSLGDEKIGTINGLKATLAVFDNNVVLNVTTIPEPSILTMLTIGAIGLIVYAWRKRR